MVNNKEKQPKVVVPEVVGQKPSWVTKIILFLRKLFHIIRQVLKIISEILIEILHTGVFLASLAFRFISSPSVPCILAIAIFIVVMLLSGGQWARVGLWVASLFGLNTLVGKGIVVACGMFAGLCLNVFQMSSEMWRISRKFANYYEKQKIDVNLDEKDETVKQRLDKWLSYDHKNLKTMRQISYVVETGLVICTALFYNPSFFGLLLGAASLILPELSLKWVTSTISLLGGATNQEPQEKEVEYF